MGITVRSYFDQYKDKETAIKIIKECKEKGFNHTFYTLNNYHMALDMAIEALEQTRWIPVSERLPEYEDYHDFWDNPDGAVLWCTDNGIIGEGWYYNSTGNWSDLWDNIVHGVVAWMPLPQPYKAESEDKE